MSTGSTDLQQVLATLDATVRPDDYHLSYDFVAAWSTLTVPSSMTAVGLTAAFSRNLGEALISCDVLAGFHHDHVLVPVADRERALDVVRSLRADASGHP